MTTRKPRTETVEGNPIVRDDDVPNGEPQRHTVAMPPTGQVTLVVPGRDVAITSCPTNIDTTTIVGKAMLLRAMSPAELEVEPGKPLRLVVYQWIVFPDQSVDEDSGEVSEFVRTVFFDGEGKTFRTSSEHTPRRVAALLELFSPAEWANGIPLMISVRNGKRGRLYHDIQIDTAQRFGVT